MASTTLRDLVVSIGWKIDDKALKKVDKLTDKYLDSVEDVNDEIGSLEKEFKSAFKQGEKTFDGLTDLADDLDDSIDSISDVEISASQAIQELKDVGLEIDDVDSGIRSIADPTISASQVVRELQGVEVGAENASASIRSIPDPKIDSGQAKKQLQDLKDEANELKDLLGGIGGALGGGAIGSDITSFAQVPREIQAQLGVTTDEAKKLAKEVENIFVTTGVELGEATEAVIVAHKTFGKEGVALGEDIALIVQQTGSAYDEIATTAEQMARRFDDIDSPQQAIDMLVEASQKLTPAMFDELLDQMGEYSNTIADAGIAGQDFFGAMVEGGKLGRYVMDRFGDAVSTELIPRIKMGEDAMMDALSVIAAQRDGHKDFTLEAIEEYDELSKAIEKYKEKGKSVPKAIMDRHNELKPIVHDAIKDADEWRESILKGGEDGRTAINEILGSFTELDKAQKNVIGAELFATLYEEQGPELDKLIEKMVTGSEEMGVSADELKVRQEGVWNTIKEKWREVRTEFGGLSDAFGGFGEVLGGLAPAIGAFVGAGGLGKLSGAFGKFGGFLSGKIFPLVARFAPTLLRLAGPIGVVAGIVIGLGITIYRNWDQIKKWTSDMVSKTSKFFGDMKNNAVNKFNELKDGATEKFNEIVTAAKELPGKIGQGIKDYASKALDGIKELANGLVKKFKEALGIASPSKVFMEMGKWITEGLVKGLSIDNLKNLGKKVFKDFAGGALSTLSAIKSFFTGEAPVGAGAARWKPLILAAAARMGERLTEREINGIIAQIQRESSGNERIVQSPAVWDINMAQGNPARGLLQYIPQTFARYAVPGHTNIYSGYDQLLAFFNNTNWRRDLPYGRRGWGPTGTRRYADGGLVTASSSPVITGEEGWELAKFPAGTRIYNHRDSKRLLRNASGGMTNNITINVQGGNNPQETARAVKDELERFFGSLNRQMPRTVEL